MHLARKRSSSPRCCLGLLQDDLPVEASEQESSASVHANAVPRRPAARLRSFRQPRAPNPRDLPQALLQGFPLVRVRAIEGDGNRTGRVRFSPHNEPGIPA